IFDTDAKQGEPGKGDFELDRNGEFSWQHDIRIYNETEEGFAMSLFNNANTPSSSVAATTGLSFDVDLVNFKVKTTRVLNDTDDVIHSVSQGSYQLLSEHTGHVAMGYGSIAEVKEFDADNNEVLTFKFGEPNAVASYRGYKCQWKATPFWKPAVVVQRTGPSTVLVHMSWNGATEYDNWAVYSSAYSDGSDPKFQALVERAGFESTIELNGLSGGFLQVIARKGDIPLGSSDVASLEIAPADEPAPTSSPAA
ncbi:ASST-domain-containing protein, partial [Aspergillus filifer]